MVVGFLRFVVRKMIAPYTFSLPIVVKFGSGESKKVGVIAKDRGWKRALIITDKGVVKAGLLRQIIESLEKADINYTIFDEVEPNPKSVVVGNATKQLKEDRSDFIIGLGGGSSMDTSKVSAMLATNPGKLSDYEVLANQSPRIFKNHPLPAITIPTTAGTGSEVDFWAGITNVEEMRKMDFGQSPQYPGGPYLGALIAIVDPTLTLTLPPKQTATTGMDALLHAIGGYVSRISIPPVSALAQYAIELVAKNLPIAYADGSDIEARENMMLAANLAGIGMNYVGSLGADHALGLALGDIYHNATHGVACSIFAPAVMEFNRIAAPSKFIKIAVLMGEKVEGLSVRDATMKAVDAVKKLIKDIELPTNLKSIGVRREDLPAIAKSATQKVDIEGNPRIIKYEDLLEIAEQVYE